MNEQLKDGQDYLVKIRLTSQNTVQTILNGAELTELIRRYSESKQTLDNDLLEVTEVVGPPFERTDVKFVFVPQDIALIAYKEYEKDE